MHVVNIYKVHAYARLFPRAVSRSMPKVGRSQLGGGSHAGWGGRRVYGGEVRAIALKGLHDTSAFKMAGHHPFKWL